jgi:hypothetical protein
VANGQCDRQRGAARIDNQVVLGVVLLSAPARQESTDRGPRSGFPDARSSGRSAT